MSDVATMFDFGQSIKRLDKFETGREKAMYLMDLLAGDKGLCRLYQDHGVEYGVDPMFLAKVFQKIGIKWVAPPVLPMNHLTMEIEVMQHPYTTAYLYVGGFKAAQVTIISGCMRLLLDAIRDQKIEVHTNTRPTGPDNVPF